MTVLPAGELVSARQPTQGEFPLPDLYVPAKHCVHVSPFTPVYPALHSHVEIVVLEGDDIEFGGHKKQSVFIALPGGDPSDGHIWHCSPEMAAFDGPNLPAGQEIHAALPVVSLYFPGTQKVHVAPLAPVKPMLHKHCVASVLPTGDSLWSGHK